MDILGADAPNPGFRPLAAVGRVGEKCASGVLAARARCKATLRTGVFIGPLGGDGVMAGGGEVSSNETCVGGGVLCASSDEEDEGKASDSTAWLSPCTWPCVCARFCIVNTYP